MKKKILNLFFPNKCPSCHIIIPYDRVFCEDCEIGFHLDDVERCKICFSPKKICNCRKEPKFFTQSIALYNYDGSVANALHTMKRLKSDELFSYFANRLADKIKIKYSDISFDAVFSVPMHRSKLRVRGFNQSEVLARKIAQNLNLPYCENVLIRPEKARAQHSLDYKQRKENVKNIYRCNGLEYEYRTLLLIDDIMTTGFTLNECAKMLVLDGANKVYCASIAKS